MLVKFIGNKCATTITKAFLGNDYHNFTHTTQVKDA